MGQSRRSGRAPITSGLPMSGHFQIPSACLKGADIVAKVFLGDERNFLGPLMRFVCGDVRDAVRKGTARV
jgi:hypothetical protein